MGSLRIYNSISGTKQTFLPINKNKVGMYVCGPTVYNNVHLGNVRTLVSFDMVFRYLKHLGYKVRYVRNITDAGHLENDEDQGEDRIAKKARLEQLEPMEVVQRYTVDFHKVMTEFNNLPPSIEPTATGHIIEQIQIIKDIIKAGFAYQVNGSVYFDVLKFNKKHQYGQLSKRNIEDLIHNTRSLDGQSDKKNPQDFALWKKAEPQHIMRWPSPWSDGFPGWHLECTAMSTKYLGNKFDIHGGGMDLKFPHHECEIAQAKAVNNGAPPVNYWMHANMLTLNGKKMAKSTGNNILPTELLSGNSPHISKAYPVTVARFFMMQAHYRSVLDFSDTALQAAEKGFYKLIDALEAIPTLKTSSTTSFDIQKWKADCYAAMDDDFNTPVLIAELFSAAKFINQVKDNKTTIDSDSKSILLQLFNTFVFDVLGLVKPNKPAHNQTKLSGTVQLLIAIRNQARQNRDYATSDRIRSELTKLGIELKDGKEGTTFSIDN